MLLRHLQMNMSHKADDFIKIQNIIVITSKNIAHVFWKSVEVCLQHMITRFWHWMHFSRFSYVHYYFKAVLRPPNNYNGNPYAGLQNFYIH